MDDFGDKLNAILSDPNAMSRIGDMAKSLMGGGETPKRSPAGDTPDIDPSMLSKVAAMMNKSSKHGDDRRALFEAMKPFLSEKRRSKMDRAIKIARLADVASAAAEEFGIFGEGGGSDV